MRAWPPRLGPTRPLEVLPPHKLLAPVTDDAGIMARPPWGSCGSQAVSAGCWAATSQPLRIPVLQVPSTPGRERKLATYAPNLSGRTATWAAAPGVCIRQGPAGAWPSTVAALGTQAVLESAGPAVAPGLPPPRRSPVRLANPLLPGACRKWRVSEPLSERGRWPPVGQLGTKVRILAVTPGVGDPGSPVRLVTRKVAELCGVLPKRAAALGKLWPQPKHPPAARRGWATSREQGVGQNSFGRGVSLSGLKQQHTAPVVCPCLGRGGDAW